MLSSDLLNDTLHASPCRGCPLLQPDLYHIPSAVHVWVASATGSLCWRNERLSKAAQPIAVCVQSVIIYRYMRPEGPWQRLAAALADSSRIFHNLILSQIETNCCGWAGMVKAPFTSMPPLLRHQLQGSVELGVPVCLVNWLDDFVLCAVSRCPNAKSFSSPFILVCFTL